MTPRRPRILLSAGEPSGDLHGAAVAEALLRRWPDAELFGLGGPRMAAAGVELLADPDRLSVMGFVEVLRHLPFFVGLMRRVEAEMRRRDADLVLPIDYPGFNLRLARRARRAGVPVLYYIAPQVWAWHRSRARELAEVASRLAVVFPFEEEIFAGEGAAVRFVGHPLSDRPAPPDSRDEFCAALGLDPNRPVLALFPGSRTQEVQRHLGLYRATVERVLDARPEVQPVLASSSGVAAAEYSGVDWPRAPDSRALLRHAAAALVKSGTTTVEAALAGTPMVIVYRTHPLTYWLARRLVEVEHIGMANLIAGRRIAPEFIQDEATPEALSAALLPLLDADSAERRGMVEGLASVRAALEPAVDEPVAERVAALAAELVDHA